MYTVVLMMALTGSDEATTFGGRRCNGGCNGGGCSVAASHGCNGRGHGCHGGRRIGRGHGCNGGGCHGGAVWSGCHGGGCHASVGCNGGRFAGVEVYRNGGFVEEQSETGPIPGSTVLNGNAPATIIVELPAEARLTVDGQPTTSTSGRRVFLSPPLAQGSEYFYTINAEMTRNGQPVTVTRRVPVTAGRETRITLDFDRDTGAQPREATPARGEAAPQPREPQKQNLERPKNNNNNNNKQNREPQPNP
jgi:uncharacterized protein (TIGR03000 family)